MTGFERWRQGAERAPDREFLVDGRTGRSWTYRDVHDRACDMGATLQRIGIQRGHRIAVLLENCPEYPILYFASLAVGATLVPINPSLHASQIEYILALVRPTLVAISQETWGLLPEAYRSPQSLLEISDGTPSSRANVSWSMDRAPMRCGSLVPYQQDAEDQIWTIHFTSGTTSKPKGVVHRCQSLLTSAAEFAHAIGYDHDTRLMHLFSMSYMAGFLNTILCPWIAGGAVVIDRPFDARMAIDFWNVPRRHRVNRLCMAPTMLAAMLHVDRDEEGAAFCRQNIRTISVCTAPLSISVRQAFQNRYQTRLCESYGLSETLFVSTERLEPSVLATVGTPLPSVDLECRDEAGAPLAPGREGEIFVRSKSMMAGYLDPETSQPDFRTAPEWFPTGDIGQIDAAGRLSITGRRKDLIIKGGQNISPRAIEEILSAQPGVHDVAVVGLPCPIAGEQVVAVIETEPGASWETLQGVLKLASRAQLDHASRPSRFIQMDSLPRSSTGKIQKAKIRELLTRVETVEAHV